MLVKFLSYAASVVGSARHRAVLVSCFVLIIAFVGILSIPLMHGERKPLAVGSAQNDRDADGEQNPVWLSDSRQEQRDTQPTDSTTVSAAPNPAENNQKETGDETAKQTDKSDKKTEASLSLSQAEVSLTAGSTSQPIAAETNGIDDNTSEVTWQVVPDENLAANDLTVINGEQQELSASFRLRTGADIKTGTYQVIVTAKSTDFNLTKTLTVTVR